MSDVEEVEVPLSDTEPEAPAADTQGVAAVPGAEESDDDELFGGPPTTMDDEPEKDTAQAEPEVDEDPVVEDIPLDEPQPKPVAVAAEQAQPEPVSVPEPEPLALDADAASSAAATLSLDAEASAAPVAAATAAATDVAAPGGRKFLEVLVKNPAKQGDGFKSFMAYEVHMKTNITLYGRTAVKVLHRYSDFLALAKYLTAEYLGVIVPAIPPKDAVGTGIMKFRSQGEEITPFILKRTAALERFMQKIAAHPVLRKDQAFISFLTTEEKVPKPKASKIASLTSKILSSYIESDEWFADKTLEVDALQGQLKTMHAALEQLVARRNALVAATTNFAESFSALADTEEEQLPELSDLMNRLSDVDAKVSKLHSKQEERDLYELSEIVFDHLLLINSIKVCLEQRIDCHRAWQSAETTLLKKKETEETLIAKDRQDKIQQAQQDVAEAQSAVDDAKRLFETVSAKLKQELKRADVVRATDTKKAMIGYVKSMMKLEQQIAAAWEKFLPYAKSVGEQ
eukprot:m.355381 g.355381  ORF g.355381 m.355381 type:complete len:514 (-) comp17240_c0_seq1:289-1830(-)